MHIHLRDRSRCNSADLDAGIAEVYRQSLFERSHGPKDMTEIFPFILVQQTYTALSTWNEETSHFKSPSIHA